MKKIPLYGGHMAIGRSGAREDPKLLLGDRHGALLLDLFNRQGRRGQL